MTRKITRKQRIKELEAYVSGYARALRSPRSTARHSERLKELRAELTKLKELEAACGSDEKT